MSAFPDPIQTLIMTVMAVALMVAAAPQLFVDWLRSFVEQQRAAVLRQQAIQEDLLRELELRSSTGPK